VIKTATLGLPLLCRYKKKLPLYWMFGRTNTCSNQRCGGGKNEMGVNVGDEGLLRSIGQSDNFLKKTIFCFVVAFNRVSSVTNVTIFKNIFCPKV
jgi:hypothetical protein